MNPIIIIDGDDNNNQLNGGSGADLINGKGGNDFLFGGEGNDTLDGGTGNDIMDGFRGANTYRWGRGAGQDIIVRGGPDDAGLNVVQLNDGVAVSDLQVGRYNDDLVLRIAGTDDSLTIHGFFYQNLSYAGSMTWGYPVSQIRFADGSGWDVAAILSRAAMQDRPMLVLDEQDNNLYGPFLDGAGGNDMLLGAGPQSVLLGGSGNDTLVGNQGNDVLLGGSGDDSLTGGFGNDILDGGSGNDVLNGEGGFDTYRFGHGSGNDTIVAPKYGQSDVLTIDMGAGVQAGTLGVLRSAPGSPDLVLELPVSGERLTVKDYFVAQRNLVIHFADGSVMPKAQIDARALGGAVPVNMVNGTPAGDMLTGSYLNDVLRGGAGNDTLRAQGGEDLLIGGDGNDVLEAFDGNNVLDGGAGDDRIMAGQGNSTVLFGRASGHDDLLAPRGGGLTTVLLEAGITPADVLVTRSNENQGPDLLISVGGAQAGIRVSPYFIPMPTPLPDQQPTMLALQFADGTLWDNALIERMMLTGNDGNNTIAGTMGNDRIDGRGGDDMLQGLQGNDLLLGGAGSDILIGGEGDDTLNGGQGNDYLDDSLGNNTYVFARGDGRDMIFNNMKMPEQRYQSIVFTDGIRPDEVHLQRVQRGSFDDLVLTIDGAPGQEITVQGYVYNDPMYATNMQLKEIRFADGSKWDAAAIAARLTAGTEAGETIYGSDGKDLIDGKGGDDTLFGKGGDDTMVGGRGNDVLFGDSGADTYVFNLGDGRDTVVDTYQGSGPSANVIRFGDGIAQKDVRMSERGADVEISYGNGGDVIMLMGNGQNAPAGLKSVERLLFADGSARMLSDYLNHAPVLAKPLPDLTAARGQLFKQSLWNVFSDPDAGDTLSLTVQQSNGQPLPAWLSYDAPNNALVGYAPLGPAAVYQLRVTATDKGGLQVSDEFSLTLDAPGTPNQAPVVKYTSPGLTIKEFISFGMLTPTFSDPDGDALSVKVTMADGSALPRWMAFDGKDWLMGVSSYDGPGSAGTYKLSATATDKGGLSVSSPFAIVVDNLNRAPAPLQMLAPLEAARGTAFVSVLPAKALADADGDALSYKLTLSGGAALPAWLSFDAATRTLSGTPPASEAASLSLVLSATDTGGLSGSTAFKLNVAADAVLNLSGSDAVDVLNGMSAGDSLAGGAGNDQLNGFGGNDTLDGGLGADRMAGGTGDDRYLVDAGGDQVIERAGEGRDTIVASVGYTLPGDTEVLLFTGTAYLAGYGNGADNILAGNSGNNFLNGYGGNDVLQGGAGNDSLTDTMGKNLFDGGAGADTLSGGASNELFIGGAGNDVITTGSGIDIIAFNRGDGSDALNPSSGLDNVISLGGGIAYADLTFKKVGVDLVLGTGAGEQISLKSWYSGNSHSVAKLQVFLEGSSDYQFVSGQAITSQKIQLFNFDALATKFDQALLANPALSSWNLAPELTAALIRSSSNMAVGGDLAHQYATTGTLANVAQVPALAIIGSSAFGDAGQYLASSPLALADGTAFLM